MNINKKEMLTQIEDTITHKKYVLDSCNKFAIYLINYNQEKLALQLLNRAVVHDNSKFEDEEFSALAKISNDMSCITDSKSKLSDYKKEAISLHWRNNSHHPEYYEDINDMTDLDLIEMVCDWHSRSIQYKTDLREFAIQRNKDRFHFSEETFNKILGYIDILLEY